MILFELTGYDENHLVYRELEVANNLRQYSFLESIIQASLDIGRPLLSQTLLKAINYHAIACLHTRAGEYRPCNVIVGGYKPPEYYRVNDQMDDFINTVNRWWDSGNATMLAAYVLWRLNYIHPFINGNGRTARAACYFVLCVKAGGLLGGSTILPELLHRDRDDYIKALMEVDNRAGLEKHQTDYLDPLVMLIHKLLVEQLGNNSNTP